MGLKSSKRKAVRSADSAIMPGSGGVRVSKGFPTKEHKKTYKL